MLNVCCFIGNLGGDPECRTMQNGKPVVNFSLAVSKKWRDRDGEQKEKTTWVPVVIFSEGLCKIAEQYLKKGSKVHISGEFVTKKWTDNNGNDRYGTDIVLQGFGSSLLMLDSRSSEGAGQGDYGANKGEAYSQGLGGSNGYGDMSDEVPF